MRMNIPSVEEALERLLEPPPTLMNWGFPTEYASSKVPLILVPFMASLLLEAESNAESRL